MPHDFLNDLHRHITAALRSRVNDAEAIAATVTQSVRQAWSGEQVYIPKADTARQFALELIRRGKSPETAARAVGVHPSTVYRWRQAERARNLEKPREHRGLERTDKWL